MLTFEQGITQKLGSLKKLSRQQRKLQEILDSPPSARRTAFLRLLESRVRHKLGASDDVAIDWGNIDWDKVLEVLDFIMKLLLMIAPFFL